MLNTKKLFALFLLANISVAHAMDTDSRRTPKLRAKSIKKLSPRERAQQNLNTMLKDALLKIEMSEAEFARLFKPHQPKTPHSPTNPYKHRESSFRKLFRDRLTEKRPSPNKPVVTTEHTQDEKDANMAQIAEWEQEIEDRYPFQ